MIPATRSHVTAFLHSGFERLRSAVFLRLAMKAKGQIPIVRILAMMAGHAMVHRSSCLSLHARPKCRLVRGRLPPFVQR